MNDDLLIASGGVLKALPSGRISGMGVVFSGPSDPDLQGDFFSRNTDFDLADKRTLRVLWEHNLDPGLKGELGRAAFQVTEGGIMISSQLDLNQRAHQKVYGLIEQGQLGLSSGSSRHLVERVPVGKSHWIRSWPIAEISLTRQPVEPRTSIMPLKSLGAMKSLIDEFDDDLEFDPTAPAAVQQIFWTMKARELMLHFDERRFK